jgi:hypothetical protein
MRPMVINALNINDAFMIGVDLFDDPHCVLHKEVQCRANSAGAVRLEHDGLVVTTYAHPMERVLFHPVRNANPFFHFFEALWILAGRNDVSWLAYFNSRMRDFSDNSYSFHGAYGHRLRQQHHDQLRWAVEHLSENPMSTRCTLTIYDHVLDQRDSKDIPCNDTLSFNIREGKLHLTVYNRSNDMVWGAYGANVVQFSSLLEMMAGILDVEVGTYSQVSNSFHVYKGEATWEKVKAWHGIVRSESPGGVDYSMYDAYERPMTLDGVEVRSPVEPCSMFYGYSTCCAPTARLTQWDAALGMFMHHTSKAMDASGLLPESAVQSRFPWFTKVALPMFNAFQSYKANDIDEARAQLQTCIAEDWKLAGMLWLKRIEDRRLLSNKNHFKDHPVA